MTFRIGGEFEIASAFLAEQMYCVDPSLPKKYVARLATGRSALQMALQEIIQRGGKRKAWLPAYICSSVVSVFQRMGYELNYYSVGNSLVGQKFPELVKNEETFLYAHYFGKKNHAAIEWLNQVDSKNFYVIEDCVQASLNSNIGNVGNYAITSYRKFLSQPDGAFLGADSVITTPLEDPDEAFVSTKVIGKLLRYQANDDELYLSLFANAEKRLEQDFMARKMSSFSEFLMARTNLPAISSRRRQNWLTFSRLIEDGSCAYYGLTPIYKELDTGEVPLGLPIRISNGRRDALRRYLAEKHIYCPIHWDLPHLYGSNEWLEEKDLSQSILTLPIDQRLGEEELNYMFQMIKLFLESYK
jgi:hypothetical protein